MVAVATDSSRAALDCDARGPDRRPAVCACVLSDVHMPVEDGFALAEQIKLDPPLHSTMILMLTSGDRPGDSQRSRQLGISSYLMKPVKQSELLDAITQAVSETVIKVDRPPSAAAASRLGPPDQAAVDLAGRGRAVQPEAGSGAAAEVRPSRHHCEQRARSAGRQRPREVRYGSDGRANARAGRAGRDPRHPRARGDSAATCRSSP